MDDISSVFQSRLRAKKEERVLRQQEQALASYPGKDVSALVHVSRSIAVDSTDDTMKRRERAEARKRVIDYQGTVWGAVNANDLDMVRNYLLVEGAQSLLRRRHPDAEQGGRPLLHCAAWLGHRAIIELILATGCNVDVVDSVASKTTALAEASRAGHSDVCVTLLRHGASPRFRDSHGDTPFHWAGRQGHGTVLLQMALEQERLEPGSTPAIWATKNYKGRSVIDLIQANAFIVPLLQKRLGNSFTRALESAKGKRRSRFPVRAAVAGARKSILIRGNSRPALNENDAQGSEPFELALTTLSGVNELGLDVSSFKYRSRDPTST